MSRIKKQQENAQRKKPETISDFQALLDANKDKLSEGDYLALCNGMKDMFEKEHDRRSIEEKNEDLRMVTCKVVTMTHEIDYTPSQGYKIMPIIKTEILNLNKFHFESLAGKLASGKMVVYRKNIHACDFTIYEDACEEGDNCAGCYNHLSHSMTFQRRVEAETYIIRIIPKEEWSNQSDFSVVRGGRVTPNIIDYIFDRD